MKPYFRNQRGAALILILFVVVFLSIVGTTLLNTTTYNLKTVVKNKSEQEEFYRAEGALEIVLTEMSHYVDAKGNSGPYFYLYDKKTPNNPYVIGSQNMSVTVNVDPSTPVVDASKLAPGTSYPVKVELIAKKGSDSRIERKLKFVTMLTIPAQGTVNISNKAINYIEDKIKQQDNYKIKIDSRNKMSSEMYNNILLSLGIDWSTFSKYHSITSSYNFPVGTTTKINSIQISGNNEKVYIPSDAIAIVDSLSFTGNGNNDYSIKVDGVLIVRDLYINGNGKFIINSGIITNKIWGNSSAASITGTANGIDCTLLPIACEVPSTGDGEGKNVPYTTNVRSLDFSTQRN